jgi:hypothetical protein
MSNEATLEMLQAVVDIANSKEIHKMKFISTTSDFTVSFANPIRLNPKRNYVFGLKRFTVYNSLFYIDSTNNRFTFSSDSGKTWIDIYIPTGAFEINSLNIRLQVLMKDKNHPDSITI